MKRKNEPVGPGRHDIGLSDGAAETRNFAAWFGMVLIAFGVGMAGWMFFYIGEIVLDPRGFSQQVDRWEFVIRGRATDAFPDAYETPDGVRLNTAGTDAAVTAPDAGSPDDVERMAEFVGRVGSKSSRPAAILLLLLVVSLLVRIVLAIVSAGIKLVYVTTGDRDFMRRVIEQLASRRNDID